MIFDFNFFLTILTFLHHFNHFQSYWVFFDNFKDPIFNGLRCGKKSILVTRNHFLSQEIISCHKKSFLVTKNHFLSQEIISCEFTSFGWTYQFATTRESNQIIRLSLYISWEPGSQVPREIAALTCSSLCISSPISIFFFQWSRYCSSFEAISS